MPDPDTQEVATATAPLGTVAIPIRQYYLLMMLLAVLMGAVGHSYYRMNTQLVLPDTPQNRQILGMILHKQAQDEVTPKKKVVIPEKQELTSGEDLLAKLRAGGYVFYWRHFQSDHSKWHSDPIKPQHGELPLEAFFDCSKQRPLSEWGKQRARHVGEIVRDLGIPIGKIRSSPYCRVVNGVKLMFLREPDELHRELIYRGGNYTQEIMSKNLLEHLGRKPEPGTNDVITAHRPQMDDIGTIREGEMWVFEPLGGERFNLVGMIKDNEWFESRADMQFLGAAGHKGGSYR